MPRDSAFVVLRSNGHVLLVQPRSDRRWQLPGGRLERGESPRRAAQRELLEETGLRVRLGALTGVYARKDGTRAFVFAGRAPRRAVPGAEIRHVRWTSLAGALSRLSKRARRRLLDALRLTTVNRQLA